MTKIEEYVRRQFRNVESSKEKEEMMQEIILNMKEKAADLMEEGKSEEDAINKVIVEFGDMSELNLNLQENAKNPRNRYALRLGFSIWGSLMIIALMVFVNLYYSPGVIWFVYPVFGVLWWPLVMFFQWVGKR